MSKEDSNSMENPITDNDSYAIAAQKIDYLYETNGITDNYMPPSKQTELRNRFKKKYDLEALQAYYDMDLWNKIWSHSPGGMIHLLRTDEEYKGFGSAASQDTAGLPMHLTKEGN